jgi:hypothetical protein
MDVAEGARLVTYAKGDRVRLKRFDVEATVVTRTGDQIIVVVDGYECSNTFHTADVEPVGNPA